jgi:predicted dehydrogenase
MKDYKACVIGAGARCGMHVQAYRHMKRASVTACCDIDGARAQKTAAEHGIKAFTSAEKMIRDEKPDLVHIVTPPTARFDLLDLVSRLGVKACTVEKPLATGVADWRRMVALEKSSATHFAVCHQFRWYAPVVRCQEILKSGRLGKVLFLDLSAGMNIAGQGTHILNYSFSLNGESPVVEVFGAASGSQGMATVHPGPDTTAGYLVYANGVRALWNNGPTAPKCGDPSTEWQHVRLAAYAEKGRVLWEEFGKWEIEGPGISEHGDFGSRETWTENNLKAQAAFHEAMLDWIEDPRKVPGTGLRQSLHEWEVVLALYASALERRPIVLKDFEPSEDLFARLRAALAS